MVDFTPRSIYLHLPFCAHHCGYCDFAVVTGREEMRGRYIDALIAEMNENSHGADRIKPEIQHVETIYLGGGTPSLLPTELLKRLLEFVTSKFVPLQSGLSLGSGEGMEFTIEANPGDIDAEKLEALSQFGVNRVSLGVQSFKPVHLNTLERQHTSDQAASTIELLRPRMRSITIDLIFGVPGQTMVEWQQDVETALSLPIDHISTYGLTYEKGTRLWKQMNKGQLVPLPSELEADQYCWLIDHLESLGWDHYEISSFARTPEHRSGHNSNYWVPKPFKGYGLGAASLLGNVRTVNRRDLDGYISACMSGQSPVQSREELNKEEFAREVAILNLRRKEGINRGLFQRMTGFELDPFLGKVIRRFKNKGWLAETDNQIRFTKEGKLFADTICGGVLVG